MARSSRPFVGALAGSLSIACLFAASRAEAYCRTSVCHGDTASVCFPSSPDDCGIPLFWPSDCIGFSIQQNASKEVTLEVATDVFATAFSNWTEAPCAAGGTPHIKVVDAGPVECHTVEYNQTKPNANIIMFDDDSWPYEGSVNTIALTTVSYDLDSGAIYDADMELNSFQVMFTTSDTGVAYDLPSIAQHETGHFLGLAHSPDPDATMFASYEMGTTGLRTLSSDDIAAICAAYPPGDAIPADCDSTPRHGFSSLCGADESDEVVGGCCAVAPGGSSDGRPGNARGAARCLRADGPLAPASPEPPFMSPPEVRDDDPVEETHDVEFVTTAHALVNVAAQCERAPRVAVDVEANGLFAYRQRLCTVQLAWEHEGATRIAIVDTLATPVLPLARLLGADGPIKVLHDLTFDAKMLADAGVPLVHARDTSVAARMLGRKATGLAALMAEVGVRIDKRFQQHDWAERPLSRAHLVYLAGDVRHLLALDDRLRVEAEPRDIQNEIDEECAYKLATALRPPRDPRPAYVRIKGASTLDAVGRAILRRLVLARESISEREDVPPFKVVSNEVLVELAQKRPRAAAGVRAVRGAASGRAARGVEAWAEAIARGIEDGDVPDDDHTYFTPSRPDRADVVRRRAREAQVAAWRRAEAQRRGIDEQAVLPGHCAQALVDLLVTSAADASIRDAIAAIAGFGAHRAARYGDELAALLAIDPQTSRAETQGAPDHREDGSAQGP